MKELVFTEKIYLYLLITVPILIYLLFFKEKKRYGTVAFSNLETLKLFSNNINNRLRFIPDILRILAIILLILAMAKPKLLNNKTDIEVKGIDIAFVLDISTSMMANDFKLGQDRLEVAKEVVDQFVKNRKNDRLSLIVFNALSYVQTPLTLDHKIFTTLLKALNMNEIKSKVDNEILEDGTAIGNAIGSAINRLKDSDTKSKIIILLTDGSNNKGNMTPRKAAELAEKANIKVYPILVGKTGRVPFPIGKDFLGKIRYQYQNNSVNPQLLREIARVTKAKFYKAENKEELSNDLMDIIDHFEQSEFKEEHFNDIDSSFHWFLIIAFFLLLLEFILRVTKFKRLP